MPRRQLQVVANQAQMGGGEVMLLSIAEAARDLAVDVTVVSPDGETARQATDAGFATMIVGGANRRLYAAALSRWRPAPGAIVWCNGLLPATVLAGRAHRVVHLHLEPQTFAQRRLLPLARSRSLATIVPSAALARVVPGAVVLPNWTGDIARVVPRANQRPRRIGFIGRLSVDKGYDVLCRAIELIDRTNPGSVELLVAGDARFVAASQRLEVAAAERPIAHLVRHLGWVERQAFFSQVDVVAVPSTWLEVFGLVAAEAMAAGVPLVVSDAGALPEVVGPDHPWVVPKGSAIALADALGSALAPDHTEAVDRARQRWVEMFSPSAGRARLGQLLVWLNHRLG